MPIKDPVAMKEYQRLWYEKNKERRKQERREHYLKNREKVLLQSKQYYLEHRDEVRARHRAYEHTPEYRALRRVWYENWNGRYRTERICRNQLNNAIRKGLITPQPCRVCGAIKSEAHHEDYTKPFDVMWLCRYHHKLLEGKIVVPREDPEQRVSVGGSPTASNGPIEEKNTWV